MYKYYIGLIISLILLNYSDGVIAFISLGQALIVFWVGGVGGREPGTL